MGQSNLFEDSEWVPFLFYFSDKVFFCFRLLVWNERWKWKTSHCLPNIDRMYPKHESTSNSCHTISMWMWTHAIQIFEFQYFISFDERRVWKVVCSCFGVSFSFEFDGVELLFSCDFMVCLQVSDCFWSHLWVKIGRKLAKWKFTHLGVFETERFTISLGNVQKWRKLGKTTGEMIQTLFKDEECEYKIGLPIRSVFSVESD